MSATPTIPAAVRDREMCRSCVFYSLMFEGGKEGWGYCHLNPPVVVEWERDPQGFVEATWGHPVVLEGNFCGHWKRKGGAS